MGPSPCRPAPPGCRTVGAGRVMIVPVLLSSSLSILPGDELRRMGLQPDVRGECRRAPQVLHRRAAVPAEHAPRAICSGAWSCSAAIGWRGMCAQRNALTVAPSPYAPDPRRSRAEWIARHRRASATAWGLLCGVGAAFFWALGFVAARQGIEAGLSPFVIALDRFVWPGLALLPVVAADGFARLRRAGLAARECARAVRRTAARAAELCRLRVCSARPWRRHPAVMRGARRPHPGRAWC